MSMVAHQTYPRPPSAMMGAADLADKLAERIESLAIEVIGEQPTHRGRHEWRFYPRGGLAVCVAGDRRGIWCHHGDGGIGGDALDLVAHVHGCSIAEAITWARGWLGQPPEDRPAPRAAAAAGKPARGKPASTGPLARHVWGEGVPPTGTPVETYPGSRGLTLPAGAPLRFHPTCPRGTERLPAMLALMTDPATAEPCGVLRTFLRHDGLGKIEGGPAKMMAGRAGVIRLVPDDQVTFGLGLAEGIETALAIMERAAWSPVWSCGCAGRIRTFPLLGGIECITVFADRDDKQGAGLEAAEACCDRWTAAAREARIELPPGGNDWLDALLPAREVV